MFSLASGFALSKLPYWIFASESGNNKASYTTFSITGKLIVDNLLFYLTQQPDVIGFGIVASVLAVMIVRRTISSTIEIDKKAVSDSIFVIGLLAVGCSYLGVFLIWRWPMGYYLFLPAILFRFVAGYGLYVAIQWKLLERRGRVMCFVCMGLMLVHATAYLWYVGASQVSYSRMYTAALQEYVKLSHEGDSLILESYPFYAEQVGATDQLLETVFHEKRRSYGIGELVNPAMITRAMRELQAVSDADLQANEKNSPGKDDYVMAFTGNLLATWQIRGVAPFYSGGSDLQRDGGYEMKVVGEARQCYPGVFINVWTHWPDIRELCAGYEIYRVVSGPRFTWLGKYPDGWMGKRARLTIYPAYVASVLVHVSTSRYNPMNAIRVFEDGVAVDKAMLFEGREQTFQLKASASGRPTTFEFEVERTFVPKKIHLNDDSRELGALVRLEPFAPKAQGEARVEAEAQWMR